jgi:hypothetical protein
MTTSALWRWHDSYKGAHVHLFESRSPRSACQMVLACSPKLGDDGARKAASPCQQCAAFARRHSIKVPRRLKYDRPARKAG